VRNHLLASVALALMAVQTVPSVACSLIPPIRPLTLPEKVAGLKTIFGGTVIGYVSDDGTELVGPLPSQCLDDEGDFTWWHRDLSPKCAVYLETDAALFRVDVEIVGPAVNQTAQVFMTWGDGDCNIDFKVGEKWLIAGELTQELRAPIRENEIAILRRLADRPPFDLDELYRWN
jgi:hypothetical protein